MEKITCQGIIDVYCRSASMQEELKKKYMDVLDQKWEKIQETINNSNVYKYVFLPSGLSFWLILGATDEYFLLPPYYCTCHDFYFKAVSKKKEICCYHVITQIICHATSRFITIYKEDDAYLDYLEDLVES